MSGRRPKLWLSWQNPANVSGGHDWQYASPTMMSLETSCSTPLVYSARQPQRAFHRRSCVLVVSGSLHLCCQKKKKKRSKK
ncbi:hypothetical protein BO99DRAFT_9192 [Aspergillus violaceofuscus CBS 115571]|uniref:Uncharacterized protein n=1 Tax=Aspergillus violaceofuscus (strain CBS 115571) TaxID=1450538 RepID=A0A2V5HDX9_ASPV1|nr:hypothetical protein BO99DRAFT_9192 [Aspergillus violaceofuscus CBS 115571]